MIEFKHAKPRAASDVNLTPMIDIIFLLIIFFMVGTKFTELERKIGLRVPEVADNGALTAAPERKVINIEREAALSGAIHTKGVMILSGYLVSQYAQDKPLSLSARLAFEVGRQVHQQRRGEAEAAVGIGRFLAEQEQRQDVGPHEQQRERGVAHIEEPPGHDVGRAALVDDALLVDQDAH